MDRRATYRDSRAASKLGLCAALLVSCTAPAPEPVARSISRGGMQSSPAPAMTTTGPLGARQPREMLEVISDSETLRALAPRGPHRAVPDRRRLELWSTESLVSSLTRPVVGARHVREGGEALDAALAALPEARRRLGIHGLTAAQLFGGMSSTGMCEHPAVDLTLTHEGVEYEARYRIDPVLLMGEPEPALYALSSTCTAALATRGGMIASAVGNGCSREDLAAHFPAGSPCRACLDVDGDHGRCVAAGACPVRTARTIGANENGRTVFYDVLQAPMLACAPAHTSTVTILTRDLGPGDPVPEPFDHSKLTYVCGYYWNAAANEPRLFCNGNRGGIRLAIADIVVARADWVRRPGDARQPLARRSVIADSLEVEGVTYSAIPLFPGTLAEVSEADVTVGGYGLVPSALRPDGTDPTNVDHTYARDWMATVAMKTTTTIDGVPIGIYNRNLCTTWRGPDALGRHHCVPGFFDDMNLPPDVRRWQYDWGAFFVGFNPERVEIIPTVTLAATGHMDPTIPGGHIPRILGSPVLADPEWENCAWPEQFQPDEMANVDTGTHGTYTFTSQTYKFGKDPRVDIRAVLSTSWRRGFCFEPL